MIKFEVVVKPFFQEIKIKGTKNMNEDVQEFLYDSLDEWGGFRMFDKIFDYHFLYDEEPEFYIYDVTNDIGYSGQDVMANSIPYIELENVKLIIEI